MESSLQSSYEEYIAFESSRAFDFLPHWLS